MATIARSYLRMLTGALVLGLVLALAPAISGPAAAQEQSRPGNFAPEQIEGIEQIVRDYLLAHVKSCNFP